MTHILVKGGKVIVQGGRVLTSQGGAPCCCGPDGCVIVLLPCCSCPGALAFIRDTPQVQAVWPFETRGDGRVVRMTDGVCYRYVATVPDLPDTATREYGFESIDGFTTCGDSSCADGECQQLPGGVIELGSPCSFDLTTYDCVESFDYAYSESGTGRLMLTPTDAFIEYQISAGSVFSGSWSLTGGSGGQWSVYTRGSRENGPDWDYSETYADDTNPVALVSPEPAASARVQNAGNLPPEVYSLATDGVGVNPGNTGHNGTIDGVSFCEQGIRRETTTDANGGTTTRTSIVHTRDTGLGRVVYASWSRQTVSSDGTVTVQAYNRLVRRFQFSNVRFASGVDTGDLTTQDQCEIPSTVIAYKCGAEDPSDPSVRIIVDLAEVPDPGSLQYRAWYEGELYIVTGELASGDPVEVVWTLDECPDDPEPTGEIYRINRCNSTIQATGGEVVGDTVQPRTIGYRVGEGMNPGEGFVYYPGVAENACLFRIPGQPTTEVLEEEPDIVLTSQPGVCSSQPVARIDPRPQCQQQDGGGGTGPSSSPTSTDPSLQAELERQSRMRTGQFPGRCPSCGG